jgi:hypothetical protein
MKRASIKDYENLLKVFVILFDYHAIKIFKLPRKTFYYL